MAARLSPQTIVSEDDVLLLVPRALWPVLKTMRAPTNVTGATSGGASGGATSDGASGGATSGGASGGATSGGASGGAMTPVRLACPRNCNARYRAEFPDMDGWSMPTHCLMRSHFARFDVQLVDTGLMLPPEVLLVDTAVRAAVPGKRVGRLGRVSQSLTCACKCSARRARSPQVRGPVGLGACRRLYGCAHDGATTSVKPTCAGRLIGRALSSRSCALRWFPSRTPPPPRTRAPPSSPPSGARRAEQAHRARRPLTSSHRHGAVVSTCMQAPSPSHHPTPLYEAPCSPRARHGADGSTHRAPDTAPAAASPAASHARVPPPAAPPWRGWCPPTPPETSSRRDRALRASFSAPAVPPAATVSGRRCVRRPRLHMHTRSTRAVLGGPRWPGRRPGRRRPGRPARRHRRIRRSLTTSVCSEQHAPSMTRSATTTRRATRASTRARMALRTTRGLTKSCAEPVGLGWERVRRRRCDPTSSSHTPAIGTAGPRTLRSKCTRMCSYDGCCARCEASVMARARLGSKRSATPTSENVEILAKGTQMRSSRVHARCATLPVSCEAQFLG